jgi:hypothetical protein
MLTPIQGEPEYVVFPGEMVGIIIPITFFLMEPCASSILIGIDVLVQLKTVTDYCKQMVTMMHEEEAFTIQLYTKEVICVQLKSSVSNLWKYASLSASVGG